MESKGKILDIAKSWATGKLRITFEIDDDVSNQLDTLSGKDLKVIAKPWKTRRSLDSNAYYWVLLTEFARIHNISKPCAHNLMLRRYGQELVFDSAPSYVRIADTEKAEKEALESETFHIRPTSQVISGTDGVNYRTYVVLLGSSYYNTTEMSQLLDGLISECHECNIETATPEELQRMRQLYERNERKNETS